MRGEREREKRENEKDSEHARETGTCGTCCGKVLSECYLTTMGVDLASAAALGRAAKKMVHLCRSITHRNKGTRAQASATGC